MSVLPKEILVKVFSHLGNPLDVGHCAQVSKHFREAAAEETVWQEMADRKYGTTIARQTVDLYEGNYKRMIADDNKLGALPTVYGIWKCDYKHNERHYHFACLVTCIQWSRATQKVLLYIDARGERDLREPITSTIWKERHNKHPEPLPPVLYVQDLFQLLGSRAYIEERPCHYESALQPSEQRRGHYKGILEFDDEFFSTTDQYTFCYANSITMGQSDYHPVKLFEIIDGQSLLETLSALPNFTYTLKNEPFSLMVNESVETEKERWRQQVPPIVLNRPGWWV